MRKCPHDHCDLSPVLYEGFRLLHCGVCGGHLLSSSVQKAIERTAGFTRTELTGEALARFQGSRKERIGCPRCHRTMDKRPLCLPKLTADFDLCRDCDLIWLDGGELAVAQLAHEATPAFASAQEMRGRAAELESDPERMAKFAEALSRMPLLPETEDGFGLPDDFGVPAEVPADILFDLMLSLLLKRGKAPPA